MSAKVRFDPKTGKWGVFISFRYKRKAKYFASETEANAFAARINKILALGDPSFIRQALDGGSPREGAPKGVPATLGEYSSAWLGGRKGEVRPATLESYSASFRLHLLPAFGAWELRSIDYAALKAFCASKQADGYSRNSVRLMMAALRACLAEAVREGLVPGNPAAALRLSFGARQKPKVDPFHPDELRAVEAVAASRRPDLAPFLMTLSRTGMRVGEAVGLDWDDLDFHRGQILIRRSVASSPALKRSESPTKTGHERRVDMSAELRSALSCHRKAAAESLLAAGVNDLSGPVFRSGDGRRLSYASVLHSWDRLQRYAGVRRRGLHALRHTYASALLSKGVPLLYVSAQLGHSSARTTLDVYAHWIPQGSSHAVDLLDSGASFASDLQVDARKAGGAE